MHSRRSMRSGSTASASMAEQLWTRADRPRACCQHRSADQWLKAPVAVIPMAKCWHKA